jgi:hypothetical protein
MTPAVLLLAYVCAAPAEPSRVLACAARSYEAESCETALAMAEAALAEGRWLFPATCMAVADPRAPARPGVRR